jgi:hypothetical protein
LVKIYQELVYISETIWQLGLDYFFFFLFLLFGQPSFSGLVRPKELTPIYLSLEEVVVSARHEVLMVVGLNFADCM